MPRPLIRSPSTRKQPDRRKKLQNTEQKPTDIERKTKDNVKKKSPIKKPIKPELEKNRNNNNKDTIKSPKNDKPKNEVSNNSLSRSKKKEEIKEKTETKIVPKLQPVSNKRQNSSPVKSIPTKKARKHYENEEVKSKDESNSLKIIYTYTRSKKEQAPKIEETVKRKTQQLESLPILEGSSLKEVDIPNPVKITKEVEVKRILLPRKVRILPKSKVPVIKRHQEDDDGESKVKKFASLIKLYNVYIAEGFKDDCELYIQRCQGVSKLNFEKFSVIWKSMGFANIYKGRPSGAEVAEVSEEVIQVAKTYMLATDRTFEVNVAGLFLVYGLLNLQPYKNFAALRIVPKDVPALLALETEARKQRRYDIIYILGHILSIGPCQFHVVDRECGFDYSFRKYYDGSVTVSDANTQPIGVLSNNFEALGLIKSLTVLDHKYNQAKKLLQDQTGRDPSLNFTTQTAEMLEDSIQEIIPTFLRDKKHKKKTLNQSTENSRERRMKAIKRKAMANVVSPIKHRTGINHKKTKTIPSASPTKSPKAPLVRCSFSAKTLTENFEFDTDDSDDDVEKTPKSILEMTFDELEKINSSRPFYNNQKRIKINKKKEYKELMKYVNRKRKIVENDTSKETSEIAADNNNLPNLCEDDELPELNFESTPIEILDSNVGRPIQVEIFGSNADRNENGNIEVEIIDMYNPDTKDAQKDKEVGEKDIRANKDEEISNKDKEVNEHQVVAQNDKEVSKKDKKAQNEIEAGETDEEIGEKDGEAQNKKEVNDNVYKKDEELGNKDKDIEKNQVATKKDDEVGEKGIEVGKKDIEVGEKDIEVGEKDIEVSEEDSNDSTPIQTLGEILLSEMIINKKTDRRGTKRKHMKSKLSKLGILDIADINNSDDDDDDDEEVG